MRRLLLVLVLVLLVGICGVALYAWGIYALFGIVVMVAIAALLAALFDRRVVIRRALRGLPVTKIADVENGKRVKVVGVLRLVGEPITAPLSGRPCAAYDVLVEYPPRGAKGNMSVAAEERRACGFVITDDTGEARIEAGEASVSLVHDFDHEVLRGNVIYRKTVEPPDLALRTDALLSGHGTSLDALEAEHEAIRFRTREGVLAEGETVAVLGTAHRGSGDGGYRGHLARVVISADGGGSLFVSDEPDTLGKGKPSDRARTNR